MKNEWLQHLSETELKDIYYNTPSIKELVLGELERRGIRLKDDVFSLPLLRSQISIQKFLKNCGFDMLISGGSPIDKYKNVKWITKHTNRVMEYIKSISKTDYIQICGIELSVIETLSDVCHLSFYRGDEIQPYSDIKKPFAELLTHESLSAEFKNWRIA